MCHQSSCPCVTVEEDVAAEECLLVYCKPVELYNILQRRAHQNPSFLPRCLNYKIEAKWKTGLMDGNVIFNYRDHSNLLRKTEVTRQFSCPFCLMRCGSFKGLRSHLITSHDLFKCEFWVTEEYRAINVSVKTDALHSESFLQSTAGGIEPRLQLFGFCSRPRKRKRPEDPHENGKYVYPHVLESALPALATGSNEGEKDPSACPMSLNPRTGELCYSYENGNANGMDYAAANSNPGVPVARALSLEDIDCVQSTCGDKMTSLTLLPAAKSRKLSSEQTEPRSTLLLQKRQFYHSHRAQPMALEQVLSDRDSEDEVDNDIAALEDRRMLDDFVDVTKDEKHLMHLWNSFVRKQRVLADGHVPWACEAFLKVHGKLLIESPALFWCWRFFMIKLWNHGLLDAGTMNNCSILLEKQRDEASTDGNSLKHQQK
ncbi:polycomb group protein EMBRYONIC FLOWER 2-like isoform X1 [Chenopodium quinoa]|uniref:polycomb group protein EMBRYONIC FLOWER 2-like isoform X1 n=1 Tax=Chenopodium quinoa TaxID=63459 RepID=UPI000B771E77|nr:polycomb group protein EMBRYONIC FLOWER 2-like isoform X1 [Chenopodium quinoa]